MCALNQSVAHVEEFICAIQDWVVDVTAVRELADYCGVEPIIFDSAAHDLMLVRSSLQVAESC